MMLILRGLLELRPFAAEQFKKFALGVLGSLVLAGATRAQIIGEEEPIQWSFVYDLASQVNPPGLSPFSEMAHAVLLPPPNDGWILIWCARYCGDAPFTSNRAFLWRPIRPTNLIAVPVPVVDGSADLFCGGQVITQEGLLVLFGGTNAKDGCQAGQLDTGHRKVWIFDNRTPVDLTCSPSPCLPAWILNEDPSPFVDADLARDRWYASCLEQFDGDILIAGHTAHPIITPIGTGQTRETGHLVPVAPPLQPYFVWDDPSLGDPAIDFRNWRYAGAAGPPCDTAVDFAITGYSHLNQVRANRVLCQTVNFGPHTPELQVNRSMFLEFDKCPDDMQGDTNRWVDGANQPGTALLLPEGAPSAQIIDLSSGTPVEVLYRVGGAYTDTSCNAGNPPSNQVLKIVSPTPGVAWQQAPPMQRARSAFNLAFGLDGSMIGIGGWSADCGVVRVAEMFRPPEIFQTGNTTSWTLQQSQSRDRTYHSWALTHPSGKIISGGGQNPVNSRQSIEIFSPSYMFGGPVPEITRLAGGTAVPSMHYSETLQVTVILPGSWDGEFRVGLLSPGAVTHSFNTSQRYIKLQIGQKPAQPAVPPAATTFEVIMPCCLTWRPPATT
jgi:hypothetical protein